jgi:putative membrane protein
MKTKAIWALGTTAVLALAYPVAAQVPSGQAKPRPPAEVAAGPESADVEFVRRAAEGGMKEVELGKLATDKASSEEVRAFGKQMVADHSKSNAELMALASMPPPSAPPKPEENLSGLSGAAFDRAYMAKMVTDHEATVELFEAEARDGKDDALRKWAAQKLPTVRGHLEKARAIQSKVAKTVP